jgi:hypothetical protein
MGKEQGKKSMQRLVTWHVPTSDDVPDGILLVEVDKLDGESDVNIVYIDDDCRTLIEPEYGDVWTAWEWQDVNRYALLEDILIAQR